MFFVLRSAFWLSVVLVLLPTGKSQPSSAPPGAVEAVSAAGAALSDMTGFCDRQPGACLTGAQAAVAFGQRAQAGAKLVYEFLSEKAAPADTGSVKAVPGKTITTVTAKPSQHTLTPVDLNPAWRGPASKDAQGAQSKHPA
ncbi:MAG: DUF5330 domain-containing protein [Pseudomonadota bacterium]|nr:DUF5330 domain-containing protein [Pseudomonadota bacterium]